MVGEKVYKSLPKSNKVKALDNIGFINYTPDSDLHFKTLSFFNEMRIAPIRIAELDDINLTKKILRRTESFAILPTNSVADEVASKTLFKIGTPVKSLDSKIFAYFKPNLKNESFTANLLKI